MTDLPLKEMLLIDDRMRKPLCAEVMRRVKLGVGPVVWQAYVDAGAIGQSGNEKVAELARTAVFDYANYRTGAGGVTSPLGISGEWQGQARKNALESFKAVSDLLASSEALADQINRNLVKLVDDTIDRKFRGLRIKLYEEVYELASSQIDSITKDTYDALGQRKPQNRIGLKQRVYKLMSMYAAQQTESVEPLLALENTEDANKQLSQMIPDSAVFERCVERIKKAVDDAKLMVQSGQWPPPRRGI
jgi:hypothetical protein